MKDYGATIHLDFQARDAEEAAEIVAIVRKMIAEKHPFKINVVEGKVEEL